MSQSLPPLADGSESVKHFIYFEDFTIGDRISLGTRVITKDEIIEFASQYDPQPFHLDEKAGSESLLGGLAASGWHTVSIFMRMFVDSVLADAKGLGASGVDFLKWKKPVYPGDSLSPTLEVIGARESNSKPNVGIVNFSGKILNQQDAIVLELEFPMMFEKRSK